MVWCHYRRLPERNVQKLFRALSGAKKERLESRPFLSGNPIKKRFDLPRDFFRVASAFPDACRIQESKSSPRPVAAISCPIFHILSAPRIQLCLPDLQDTPPASRAAGTMTKGKVHSCREPGFFFRDGTIVQFASSPCRFRYRLPHSYKASSTGRMLWPKAVSE